VSNDAGADLPPIPWHEMGGLGATGVAFFLAWSYLYPLQSGAWGEAAGLWLWRGTGEGGLVLCLAMGMLGVLWGFPQVVEGKSWRRWLLVALWQWFVLEAFCGLVSDTGGATGRLLAGSAVAVVGPVGAGLFYGAVSLFILMAATRWSASRWWQDVVEALQDSAMQFRHRLPKREQPPEEPEVEEPEVEARAQEEDEVPWDDVEAHQPAPVGVASKPVVEKPEPEPAPPPPPTKAPVASPAPASTVADSAWDLARRRDTDYRIPPLELLQRSEPQTQQPQRDHSRMLMETLQSFGVTAAVTNAVRGPTVTRYELSPARGVKVSSITALSNDLALALAAQAIRLEAPIPGKSAIGIEVPNDRAEVVGLRELLEVPEYKKAGGLPIALGRDISGRAVVTDLLRAPHLLIAGSTGSGKSVCLNTIIASVLYRATPLEVQMVMVDIKRVELSIFEGIPHLAATGPDPKQRIVTDAKTGTLALKNITDIMMQRYDLFTAARVRNIGEYNRKAEAPMPFLVVIIDELAELMQVSARAVEGYIQRIAQMGRAAGLHLILATQRPSVDVITGTIKANFPARIAFAVKSQVDSRTILDRAGAEKLLGRGDMLFSPTGSDTFRVQGAYVDISEMERVIDFWKGQSEPENLTGITVDTAVEEVSAARPADEEDDADEDLIQEALKVIRLTKLASASNLQRKLKLGYPKAGRLMDVLERRGFVGPADGAKPRKILFMQDE
jgi:S-DNA-T family DNA segregation ATPase FtsK/SpoIIIE